MTQRAKALYKYFIPYKQILAMLTLEIKDCICECIIVQKSMPSLHFNS